MIRVAIVEDEEAVREQLLGYVQRYTRQYGTTFEVRTFSDGVEILEGYRPVFDLILLDVEMKHLDGMETAQRIRALDSDVMIVFITNMAQYAIKGYAVGALDYVLKPVPYFAFSQQLQKAEEPPYPALSGCAGGGWSAAAGHLPHLLYRKRGPPGAFLHRRGRLCGPRRAEGTGRKAGRPPLCPLQQRLPCQSGTGTGRAAEHGAGWAL